MIASYEKYIDTGIEFIGSVPEKWEAKRIKFGVNSLTGFAFKSNEYKDKGIKLARGINVKEAVLNWDDTKYWDDIFPALKKYFLMQGDVLIQMDGSKVGKNYCIINEADLPILLVQRVTRLRTKKTLNSKFLFYTIACQNFFNWVSISKTDPLVPHITLKDIENYAIALPPLDKQIEIAKYLDNKTQAIDKKINLLTKKANYYKELRKSIINDAVCKGLDKNVKLKDCGIEWIGKIPEHWEVKRIKDIFSSLAGGTPSTKEKDYWIGEIPWIPSGKVQNNIVVPEVVEDFISEKALKESSTKIAKQNSILIALTGATCSNIGYLTFDTTINQSIVALLPKSKLTPKYYFYFLISGSEKIRTYMTGGAQGGINQEDVKFLKVLLPLKEEQTAIANYLDEKTQKIDAIVSNIGKQIETLKELRKTLINDVVTGKIKVVK